MKNEFRDNLDKSGKMFRLKYLEKYHQGILNDIILFSKKYKLVDLSFKQKVYHWYHKLENTVLIIEKTN